MRFVVDASAAVELLLRTSAGMHVAELIRHADLVAPDLLDAEVLAVLRREWLARRLSRERAEQALEDLRHSGIERIANARLVPRAWAIRNNVSAYDALYVAAAELCGGDLLTADGPLSRAPGIRISIHNVR